MVTEGSEYDFLTTREVAEILRLRVSTVSRMLKSGDLDGIKVRGRWRVRKKTLEDYLSKANLSEGD